MSTIWTGDHRQYLHMDIWILVCNFTVKIATHETQYCLSNNEHF